MSGQRGVFNFVVSRRFDVTLVDLWTLLFVNCLPPREGVGGAELRIIVPLDGFKSRGKFYYFNCGLCRRSFVVQFEVQFIRITFKNPSRSIATKRSRGKSQSQPR